MKTDLVNIVNKTNSVDEVGECELLGEGKSDAAVIYFLAKMKKMQTKLDETDDLNERVSILSGMMIANASISVLNGKSANKSILGRLKKMISAVI